MRTVSTWGRPIAVAAVCNAVFAFTAGSASAQDITVGDAVSSNAFPFQQYEITPPNRFQQVYSASAFSSAVFIDAIRFHTTINPGTGIAPGTYLLRFSTTASAVDGLSTDFDSNLGLDTQIFFSGMLSGEVRIVGSPFLFNPAAGNLLLDIIAQSPTRVFTGGFDNDHEAGDEMSRVVIYNAGADASPTADTHGLVTTFETRVAAVPEPMSMMLLGTGLAGLAALRWRRRRITETR